MAVLYVDNNQGGELVNSKPKKTNKPTGLSVKRSGNKFALTWKNAEKYELLAFWYRTKGQSSWRAWQTLTGSGELIPPGSTGKAITIDSSKFYPNKSGTITAIEFKLKALGKYYETGKGEKRQGWYRTWSDSATKQVTINIPASPSVSGALSDEASNECTFSWSVKTDNANSQMFSDIQWETMLVANCSETDGNKLKWSSSARGYAKGTGGASGSRKVIDDTVAVASGTNTRWFRVRARGKAGATAWKYAKHVYALPLQAKDVRASATITDAGGFQCYLTWTADGKVSRPIDRSTVQWSISVPDVNMSCPNGASWTDGNVSRDTGGRDAAVFSIDDVLSEDQCLFVRVNTHHDTYVTYGLPVLASVGQLKKPTGLTVNINEETHKATVTATNNSEVEDSFLVVKYQTESGVDLDVGIIPFGDDHVTVTCPDWSTERSIAFGVYAVVGRYQKVERPDGADAYSVAPTMQSEMVWRGGDVPTAPTNVMAQVTQTVGTVRLTWDWSWEGANGAEISWADHEDAWESTDEPETYIISNLHASRWNIAGLDTGKRWYFRVRLMNGDGDDETTYSPYSELTPDTWIDLTAAPTIPTLTLGDGSQGIITETGNINASWVYVSNDGTSQIYAEICDIADLSQIDSEYIASVDEDVRLWKRYFTRAGSGTEQDPYEYTEVENPEGSPSSLGWYELNRAIIAHTETAQHVLLDASTYGWRAGEIHQLAVRVKSASGVVSDGWSDPVPLMIATPIEAVIASTSLIKKSWEVNPSTASGNPAVFTTEAEEDFSSVRVDVEPVQDGTPSASNHVPITGWDKVDVTLSPTANAGDGETFETDLSTLRIEMPARVDTSPYHYRPTPSGVSGVKPKIVGGSFGWNQLANQTASATKTFDASATYYGNITGVYDTDISFVNGHKYLVGFNVSRTIADNNGVALYVNNSTHGVGVAFPQSVANGWGYAVCSASGSETGAYVRYTNFAYKRGFVSGDTITINDTQLIDLTILFGTTIADYIYSLEQSTAGAGVAWVKKNCPKLFEYHEYSEPTLISVEGLVSRDVVGFNQWDEEWEVGTLDSSGQNATASDRIRSKKYISVLPKTTYYVKAGESGQTSWQLLMYYYDADKNYIGTNVYIRNTTNTSPSNAHYMRFNTTGGYGTTYNHDICINLSWSGWRNGEYEPYEKHSYPLDSSLTLRGIPKLDAQNNLYYDGDEYKADGSVTRRYGIVDLGTLKWIYQDSIPRFYTPELVNVIKPVGLNSELFNGICTNYSIGIVPTAATADKMIAVATSGNLFVKDTSYSDETAFKAAMSGVYLVYELATPTTESAQPYTSPQKAISGGTEEFVSTGVVPVGQESEYYLNGIYGGRIDLITGILTSDRACIASYNGEEINKPWLSDRDVYASGRTPTTGAQVVYPLTEPETYQLTPLQIATLVGANRVWSNAGSMRLRYAETSYLADALAEMPLRVTVTGAGENGLTTVAVERAESYHVERPDENAFNGFEGETIAIASHVGEDEFVFEISDLIGRLDDGAKYNIVATIQDDIGQKSETELPFEVMWDEQAIRPTATAEVDEDNYAVKIAIGTPSGAGEGAVCDVYRLSADRPELIFADAPLGSTIVDPSPATGPRGGHRIVYKTVNGDYITSDYEMAWIDLQEDEDDIVNIDMAVIDFEGGQILLEYNLDASHSWSKDFKETKYLGGSVQGDWNPAVSRTLSLSATAISLVDADKILMLRRLADTPSICHVRTPDGSSFSADVQVNESTSTGSGGVIYDYSLTITQVDPESPDGMTLEDWQRIHGE